MDIQAGEIAERLLDQAASGRLRRRGLLASAGRLGVAGLLAKSAMEEALAAGDNQRANGTSWKKSYDYIVVGAGAAGCIIASRLARAGASVLVVEAGGTDQVPQVNEPRIWVTNLGSTRDWNFTAAPSPYVDGRRVPVATGHVLGGGTSINAMLWVRGMAQDFDGWEAAGCTGWGFRDLLPIYRSLEDWQGGANEWRGAGGPVHVETIREPHPTAVGFVAAAKQMGIPIHKDLNGPMQEGAGYANLTIASDGTRVSAARAFLRPALGLPNLTLLLNTEAVQLLFSGSSCTGLRIRDAAGETDVLADREVIVTSGGLGSAKLLLASGVGDADASRRLGITPVLNLKGVGENYQDHPLLFGRVFGYKGKMPPPASSSNNAEAIAFIRSTADKPAPDIAMVLMELPVLSDALRAKYGSPPPDSFTISPALVRPTSRGSYRLASADIRDPAILEGNYLATEEDLTATMRCIELCGELGRQSAFDSIRTEELVPGHALSGDALRDFARQATISFGHPVGTCKMGTDELAVVDPELKVQGITGLRVCDSSVMPNIVTGPTSAASHVIGAKAAVLLGV
jgi:choline dehydrogenase